jgi:hypothetical protein
MEAGSLCEGCMVDGPANSAKVITTWLPFPSAELEPWPRFTKAGTTDYLEVLTNETSSG